jgi:hypothetical protein
MPKKNLREILENLGFKGAEYVKFNEIPKTKIIQYLYARSGRNLVRTFAALR